MEISKLTIILYLIKTILECGVIFTVGYLWGQNRGFDVGFRLGTLLADCRNSMESKENTDAEKQD